MKFIRLDQKGTWKGTEHISGFGIADETDIDIVWEVNPETGEEYPVELEKAMGAYENGISCYNLGNVREALESLHNYWFNYAGQTGDDYKEFQVTIFEGELVGTGSDGEDTAECTSTLKELDAYEFMKKLDETIDQLRYDEITEEEYEEILKSLV